MGIVDDLSSLVASTSFVVAEDGQASEGWERNPSDQARSIPTGLRLPAQGFPTLG